MANTLFKNCDAIVSCDQHATIYRHADLLVVDNAIKKIATNIAPEELPESIFFNALYVTTRTLIGRN